MKVLFASDGSDSSDNAARYLVGALRRQTKTLRVALLHVDAPIMERVAVALGQQRVAELHRENSEAALKSVRRRLKRARVHFDEMHAVGNVAEHISRLAEQGRFDLVLMGSHGHTALSRVLLGSATAHVLAECRVPVLVVH